jgi:hypothetical protein
MRFVRYEILLPLFYNDGSPVEAHKFEQTREELLAQFDALSLEPGGVRGTWIHEHKRYEDPLVRYFVDCPDTISNRRFFRSFKASLKDRFAQLDIWITAHRVRIV